MKAYLAATRSPWCSYVFVLPLLLLYQLLLLPANFGHRRAMLNGADALIQLCLHAVGVHGWLASWMALTVIVGLVVYRLDPAGTRGGVRRELFPLVMLESTLYALLFGSVTAALTSLILPFAPSLRLFGGLSWLQMFAGSLGAGLYEELVFRLILVGGGVWLLRAFGMTDGAAALCSIVGSSVLFSLIHYVGPLGDMPSVGSFVFRFVAGVLLSGLFLTRGFAVAAWTHALYDVFLLVVGRA